MEEPLLMPSTVAGGAVGNTENKAGNKMSPPPPTMASTKPASKEAKAAIKISIGTMVSKSLHHEKTPGAPALFSVSKRLLMSRGTLTKAKVVSSAFWFVWTWSHANNPSTLLSESLIAHWCFPLGG
jgi:hypothetical protein